MPYYPLNKITPNQYTSGNQFTLISTGQDYKGYYFSTYDGKYFTGEMCSPDSKELSKNSDAIKPTLNLGTAAYDSLRTSNIPTQPEHYTSVPTEQDYKNGYYLRYFTKRVNGDLSTITEVTKTVYDSMSNNPLYNRVQIQWMLTGPIEDKYITGMLVLGVVNRNIKTITQAARQMQYLDQYLVNPTQYYKN
jgi:hypothetical protein